MSFDRSGGILLHPTSLPGRYGIGDLGPQAFKFLDWLASTGCRLWQVLPLGPTGYGDSPYQSFSAFAGNPYLISFEALIEDGLLTEVDFVSMPKFSAARVDYGQLIPWKLYLLEKAFVQLHEMGWVRPGLSGNGQNSYAGIEGGYIYAALGQVTGQSTISFASTSSGNFQTFVNAWNAGKSIGFATKSSPANSNIVGNHAYSVIGYNTSNQTITLYNPWGAQYGSYSVTLTLTWSQIQSDFSYFDRTA